MKRSKLLKLVSLIVCVAYCCSMNTTVFADTIKSSDIIRKPGETYNLIDTACEYYGIQESGCTVQEIADYFTEEIHQLSLIYPLAYPQRTDSFTAVSVENRIPVFLVSLDKEGVYLDFNGNHGYLIISEDFEVIEWKATGDLEYLKQADYAYYSLWDGFGYYSENQFIPFERMNATAEKLHTISLETPYDGQETVGDGNIYDPTAYVNDKYGSGYTVKNYDDIKYLSFTYFKQSDYSIYYKIENGLYYGEGNCSLSAIFAQMNKLKTSGKHTGLPAASKKTSYDATQDSFYSEYNNSNYYIATPKSLPNLYLAIRQNAIDAYGYERQRVNPLNIVSIIENVGSQYNETIDATHHVIWSFESQVVDEINAGYSVIINVASSSTYGSHSMVITGYVLFTKTTSILGIDFYDYAKLARVNDNWTAEPRYFDLTEYSGISSVVTAH